MICPGDIHAIFDATTSRCTIYRREEDGAATELFRCEMHNRTVRGGFGKWGKCPRGLYELGRPVRKDSRPFGPWFVPLVGPCMALFGRRGIGIHGGGSCCRDWKLPRQAWCPTEACLREQNEDLCHLVRFVQTAQVAGRRCFITVEDE